jgi:hypothetical protein
MAINPVWAKETDKPSACIGQSGCRKRKTSVVAENMDDRIFLPLNPVWVLNGGLQRAPGPLYNLFLASESAKRLLIR